MEKKNVAYIYSLGWFYLEILFYQFIFLYFDSSYFLPFTINLPLSPLLCIFFQYKKGSLSLSLKFFFHSFVEIFYFSCISTLDWWILLTNSYVFLDASIFFIIFFTTLNTFNEWCFLLISFREYHIIIRQILCCFPVLIYLKNNKIVWTS